MTTNRNLIQRLDVLESMLPNARQPDQDMTAALCAMPVATRIALLGAIRDVRTERGDDRLPRADQSRLLLSEVLPRLAPDVRRAVGRAVKGRDCVL
jgi:hypothetical protein